MKKKKLIFNLIGVLCISGALIGCSLLQEPAADIPKEPEKFELKKASDIVYEVCVCHSINVDGSLLLWGDRIENNLFCAYAVENLLDLKQGDEIILEYSESQRKLADIRSRTSYNIYALKSGTYDFLEITERLVNESVDGTRKDKFLAQYEKEREESLVVKNDVLSPEKDDETYGSDDTPVQPAEPEETTEPEESPAATESENSTEPAESEEGAPVQKEQESVQERSDKMETLDKFLTPEKTVTFNMDTRNISDDGELFEAAATYGTHMGFTVHGRYLSFNAENDYVFAQTAYDVTDISYLGTVYPSVPQNGQVLIYLNGSHQICAGRVNNISTIPGGQCMVYFDPIDIKEILDR